VDRSLGSAFQIWLVLALAIATGFQFVFYRSAPEREQRSFHRTLAVDLLFITLLVGALHLARTANAAEAVGGVLGIVALIPLGALIRNVRKFNFLQIGHQRNLIFAVFLAFVALLYLSFIRRASQWLDPYLPPEATAAILLFLPVVFFEPLQRFIGRHLRETAHREVGRVQELMAEIQQEARQGDAKALAKFVERRLKETFELAAVSVQFWKEREISAAAQAMATEAGWGKLQPGKPSIAFSEGKVIGGHAIGGSNHVGSVRAEPHGSALSGETHAALELLCEQLPAVLSLCWLIEEKLQLERELAERERLALVGQMAASISHNLKNPLGSMKTILQLQLENPQMPESLRAETKMVLDEVGRLSAKLNQLLQFSRPAVRGGEAPAHCDSWSVAEQVVSVLRPEAERRGVYLELANRNGLGATRVGVSSEALNDVLSNLIVNAIEAGGRAGRVEVSAESQDGAITFAVQDDGPGVPEASRDKILQPFFTTKSQGTGLGLAIVARRVAEAGGELRWLSPVREGRGTRFEVSFKLEKETVG
jgi:signal transduction histidine kinase